MKYSHGPLVSAQNARSHDYGTPTSVGTVPSSLLGVGGVNAPKTGLSTAVSAAALDSPTDTGGEVVVPKTFPLSAQEPTCEQLRAMWIFSKRQSRAAEITNEIPTYRDPFAYNVWEPYYSTIRSMGGGTRLLSRYGDKSRSPVFGRVVSREPLIPKRVTIGYRQRHYGADGSKYGSSSPRIYGAEPKATSTNHGGAVTSSSNGSHRPSKYRYVGANGATINGANGGNTNSLNVQGSFQRLKELIWTERAKELTQQRRAEELAARAAVLKEIANGQNIQSPYKYPVKSESLLMDENRSPDRDIYQHLNDDRMSIATGQSPYIVNNYNNKQHIDSNSNSNNNNDNSNRRKNFKSGFSKHNYKGGGKTSNNNRNNGNKGIDMALDSNGSTASSLRSYTITNRNRNNKNYDAQISFPPIRTGNVGSSAKISQTSNFFEDEQDIGIPRTYPLRPSHFRERNRVIFKEDLPLEKSAETDYFSREIRSQPQDNVPNKHTIMLEHIIENLSQYTPMTDINTKLMENYIANKTRNDAEVPAMLPDDFYSDELDVSALSSNGGNSFVNEDPLETNVNGWNELDVADANAFLNYVNSHAGYRPKEAGEPVELYDFGSFY